MIKYILGLLKNFFNPAVSFFSRVDNISQVDRKSKIYPHVQVFNSKLGSYSYVGKYSSLVYVDIGKFCSIASGVNIGMGIHTLTNLSTSPIFTEKNNATKFSWTNKQDIYPYNKIVIGNDVWIGYRSIIMGGVKIGNGAIIGAGAIVTKDVPPYAIVGGVPAKIIRYRFSNDVIEYLESLKWWDLPEEILKNHIDLFQSSEINIEKIKKEINN